MNRQLIAGVITAARSALERCASGAGATIDMLFKSRSVLATTDVILMTILAPFLLALAVGIAALGEASSYRRALTITTVSLAAYWLARWRSASQLPSSRLRMLYYGSTACLITGSVIFLSNRF